MFQSLGRCHWDPSPGTCLELGSQGDVRPQQAAVSATVMMMMMKVTCAKLQQRGRLVLRVSPGPRRPPLARAAPL